ncbi:MFS transporter [Myxococcota bacterium]|nr:MFS transporter [Myxococcota bacterium]
MGLAYAFLYMGRYNLTVAKNALGDLMSKADFGEIFGVGAFVYGLSFIINGPLTDRIGGRRTMLMGVLGALTVNVLMGLVLYGTVNWGLKLPIFWTFLVLYALNMYFQSFGAVAIVTVKAPWFHVRERGTFSTIFGVMISLGIYFASTGDLRSSRRRAARSVSSGPSRASSPRSSARAAPASIRTGGSSSRRRSSSRRCGSCC